MAAQNLIIPRGDTYTFTATVTQAGAAFNLTGCTLRMTAKWQYSDADSAAVFTRTSPSGGITITNAAGGLASVTVAPLNTSGLAAAVIPLVWDLQLTDGSSNVYTLTSGTLTVMPDVSITTP